MQKGGDKMEIIEQNGANLIDLQNYNASCHSSGCPQCDDCSDSRCWDFCDVCPPNR